MLIEKAAENGAGCRIPGIVITKNGTLLGYYECRNSYLSDWAEIDIKVIRSTDKGENWESAFVISSNGNTLNNPVMIVDGANIHFLYCQNYKQLFYCKSVDDGKTFSVPTEITSFLEDCGFFYSVVAVGPGHGIVHNGNLIVPVWFAANHEDPKEHHPSFIGTIYSSDGIEWHLGEIIGKDVLLDPSESALAVTKDNRVLISIRNETTKCRALAVSDTGYSDWQDLRFAENLPDPICQGSMCFNDTSIFHINCDSSSARENLTVKTSEDNFQSYKSIYVDEKAGYSDIAIEGDWIYIFYEHMADCELHFKKIFLSN